MADAMMTVDWQNARNLAEAYARATGMECLVLIGEEVITPPLSPIYSNGLCFQRDAAIGRRCLATHRHQATRAHADGSTHAYFCPMGLVHWASPITQDNEVVGAFLGGHAFLGQGGENVAALRELAHDHKELLQREPELREELLNSPVVDKERLEGLKRILDLLARVVSVGGADDGIHRLPPHNGRRLESPTAKQFADAVRQGDLLQCERTLKLLITELRESRRPLDDDRAILTELLLTVCDSFTDENGEHYLHDHCYNDLHSLGNCRDHDTLADWTAAHLRVLLEEGRLLADVRHADMIYSALAYIDSHYAERIGLSDLADHVHFSAPYFSKVFKRETGRTFTQYLTMVRIESGKKLLADKSIALAEIPGRVGFEEQSYFTKVFRASVGMSPGRYRDQL